MFEVHTTGPEGNDSPVPRLSPQKPRAVKSKASRPPQLASTASHLGSVPEHTTPSVHLQAQEQVHMGLDGMPVTRPVDKVAADPDMPDAMDVESTEYLAQEVKEINIAEEESPNKEAEQAGAILTDLVVGCRV